MLSRADLDTSPRDALEGVILLSGTPPSGLVHEPLPSGKTGRRTHADADADLLALGRALAERIRERPELTKVAAEIVRRQLRDAQDTGPSTDLDEWLRVLERSSAARVAQLLESETERGRRLRQSPVVMRALSAEEREDVRSAARRVPAEGRRRG